MSLANPLRRPVAPLRHFAAVRAIGGCLRVFAGGNKVLTVRSLVSRVEVLSVGVWLTVAGCAGAGDVGPSGNPHDEHGHGDHGDLDHGTGEHTGDGHGDWSEPYACVVGTLVVDVPVVDHTANGADELSVCHVDASGRELGYEFVAPADGHYLFRVDSDDPSFDPTLGLIEARDDCEGERIACADDRSSDSKLPELGAFFRAGQAVIVVVDGKVGANGPFRLDVTRVVGESCPDEVLDGAVPLPLVVHGDTSTERNSINGTCSGSAPDRSFQWTAPYDGRFVFETTGSLALGHPDPLLHVRDGDCSGPELACRDDIEAGVSLEASVEVELAAQHSVVVTVDGWIDQAGPFVLTIREAG